MQSNISKRSMVFFLLYNACTFHSAKAMLTTLVNTTDEEGKSESLFSKLSLPECHQKTLESPGHLTEQLDQIYGQDQKIPDCSVLSTNGASDDSEGRNSSNTSRSNSIVSSSSQNKKINNINQIKRNIISRLKQKIDELEDGIDTLHNKNVALKRKNCSLQKENRELYNRVRITENVAKRCKRALDITHMTELGQRDRIGILEGTLVAIANGQIRCLQH